MAREEGIKEGIEKMATGLLRENILDDIIISTTGLSRKQLEFLKKNTHKK
ncbi:MAG: hypothetical protein ACLFUB_19790 [Cyclobacteriaceae bacterium]